MSTCEGITLNGHTKKLEGINEFSERKTQKRPLIVIRRTCALKKKRQDLLLFFKTEIA